MNFLNAYISRLLLCLLALPLLGACQHQKQRNFTPLEYVHYTTRPELEERLTEQGLKVGDPVYIRAFKSEMQMEVWLRNQESGKYDLFRTYPICRASGTIGPKLAEGDLQAPEGFYEVGKKQLNPNSKFYLSFNLGFPNKYDRSYKRTGSALMIHGNCVSTGCFAMTDEHIGEIYLLVEESIKQNKQSVPVHIFPFRMTEDQMELRKYSQWYPFWLNIKEGYDLFEQTHIPPEISVENKRYAFKSKGNEQMPGEKESFKMAQK